LAAKSNSLIHKALLKMARFTELGWQFIVFNLDTALSPSHEDAVAAGA
jgi:hypothetical protein